MRLDIREARPHDADAIVGILNPIIRADNPAALETYLSQGFRTVGTAYRQARVGSRYVDEIIIEKRGANTCGSSGAATMLDVSCECRRSRLKQMWV
jgi:hypothetical protein